MTTSIGASIRRARTARGWSQSRLADALNDAAGHATLDRHYVSRWERGARAPRFWLPHLVRVLGLDLAELERAPRTEPGGEVVPVDRRAFVQGAAVVALGVGMASARHVDPALIGYFQGQLAGHKQADRMLGGRDLIGTVDTQCTLIGGLVDAASGSTRVGMARAGVSYAIFAAWLHLEAGDPVAALRWHDMAQEWAHRSRDREAVALALSHRAMVRIDQGAGAAAVDLCEAALTDGGKLSPEVRVYALQRQAHGASLLGDRAQVDRLLDTAAGLMDRVHEGRWGIACLRVPNYVEVQRATCYGRLGLARDADRMWSRIIPAAPSAVRRDVGVWSARQATTAAALGEPERAVELARGAVDVVVDTGSARARREVVSLAEAMAPWRAHRVGHDLAVVLAPIGEGS